MARVLVLEDSGNLRIWYLRELEIAGHEVLTAATIEEALEVLHNCRVDFVVMDITQWPIAKAHDMVQILLRHRDVRLIANIIYDMGQAHFVPSADQVHITKSPDLSGVSRKIREIQVLSSPLRESVIAAN